MNVVLHVVKEEIVLFMQVKWTCLWLELVQAVQSLVLPGS